MVVALLLGGCVGFALGLLGGGGSVLAVPGLTEGLGLEARAAVATSLVVVGVAAAVGALMQARAGHVRLRPALIFGLLGMPGALVGARLGGLLPGTVQLLLFAAVMIVAGTRMLRGPAAGDADQEIAPASAGRVAAAALGTGLLTGVVGVGGGFLIVPALVLLVGLPMREAIGSSLLVIALNAAAGSIGYLSYLTLDTATVLPFVIGAVVATPAGAVISRRIAPERLRTAFGVGVLVVAAAMVLRQAARLFASGL